MTMGPIARRGARLAPLVLLTACGATGSGPEPASSDAETTPGQTAEDGEVDVATDSGTTAVTAGWTGDAGSTAQTDDHAGSGAQTGEDGRTSDDGTGDGCADEGPRIDVMLRSSSSQLDSGWGSADVLMISVAGTPPPLQEVEFGNCSVRTADNGAAGTVDQLAPVDPGPIAIETSRVEHAQLVALRDEPGWFSYEGSALFTLDGGGTGKVEFSGSAELEPLTVEFVEPPSDFGLTVPDELRAGEDFALQWSPPSSEQMIRIYVYEVHGDEEILTLSDITCLVSADAGQLVLPGEITATLDEVSQELSSRVGLSMFIGNSQQSCHDGWGVWFSVGVVPFMNGSAGGDRILPFIR